MSVLDDFRKKNKPVNIKAIFDIVMGLVYAIVGTLLVIAKYIGFEIALPKPEFVQVFGALAFLYGAFRIFRGIKLYRGA